MTPEQIREIVKITLDELTQRKLLELSKVNYAHVTECVENEMNNFFKGYKTRIGSILNQLSDDQYIDIIFLQYRDCKTLEWIAEYMGVDVSTVKRNKKRLIYKIYELLEV